MIDSFTIASKGGLIVYENLATGEVESNDNKSTPVDQINQFINDILLDPTKSKQSRATLDGGVVVESQDYKDFIGFVVYPEVVLRAGKTAWLQSLLSLVLRDFVLFWESQMQEVADTVMMPENIRLFDATFDALWKRASAEKDNTSFEPSNSKSRKLSPPRKTGGKGKRTWGEAKVTDEAMKELDYSKDPGASLDVLSSNALAEARAAYLPDDAEVPDWEEPEPSLQDGDADEASTSSWGSSLKGWLDQMSGNKILTASDLDGPLATMQKQLEEKNVASDIASEICISVKKQLVGKRMTSFSRIKTAVRQGLEAAIVRILTPPRGKQVDVLRGVLAKRSSRDSKPFVIVMVGINGVGKSTSLAKIAYYLKKNGCSPLIAACDTFRSGAVEQLSVHAKCLDVPLYHKGYAKDPSAVAAAAITQAAQDGQDVVMVDTAGRMQNNVPLMKALSKLVVENKPDLVLFVCEALVGNDGMDQLSMFNKALRSGGHARQIDGIILTKWDTVSEKVGAALTLTHVTGAPVVFTGTGQKYNHLRKLNAPAVIKSLFS